MKNHDNVKGWRSEFDQYADDYLTLHKASIAASGEDPEYFSAYKVAEAARLFRSVKVDNILDFGCGIGSSMPHFRAYFPSSSLICADVSERSLEVAMSRFPNAGKSLLISADSIDLPDASVDLIFTACTFHHIPEYEHVCWFRELRRLTRPDGNFVIFEHNPLNPLTVHAVNTCAFDINAKLIRAARLRQVMLNAGWRNAVIRYHIFFPRFLAFLRPLERYLSWLPLGAQYSITAQS
jgi:SAM-dependent methyltransferase